MRTFFPLLTALLTLQSVSAQLHDSHLPISGYVHDPTSRSLRPVVGVPGSAHLGKPSAENIEAAWVSPRNKAAVLVREGATVLVLDLAITGGREQNDTLLDRPSLVCWSNSGDFAVLYSDELKSLQRLSLSNQNARIDPPIPLDYLGPIRAISVSDSGHIALAGPSGVHVLREGHAPKTVSDSPSIAVAFRGDDQIYASTGDAILSIAASGNNSQPLISDIRSTGLGVSISANRLWAVDTEAKKLYVWSLDGEPVAQLDLDRAPTHLRWLRGDSILLLNGPESGRLPALVIDLNSAAGVFFVPSEPVSAL